MLFIENMATFFPLVIEDNFKIERFCLLGLGFPRSVCQNLGAANNTRAHIEAQKVLSFYNLAEDVVSAIFPILILLFTVTWSDHHGRKWLILLSLLGKVLDMAVYLAVSAVPSCPAPVLMVGHVLRSLGGDQVLFSNAVYSYIADRTDGEDRTYRMTMVCAFWFLGQPVGVFLGPVVYDFGGYMCVFSSSLALYVICIAYTLFAMEAEFSSEQAMESGDVTPAMFSAENIKELLKVIRRPRDSRTTFRLWVHVLLMVPIVSGKPHNMYMWSRRVLVWEAGHFSNWQGLYLLLVNASTLAIGIFIRSVVVPDSLVGLVAMALDVVQGSVLASIVSASQSAWMYAVMAAGLAHQMEEIAVRAGVSKVGGAHEIGRLMFLVSCVEAVWPLVDHIQYAALYSLTLTEAPSAIHLLFVSWAAVGVLGFLALTLLSPQDQCSSFYRMYDDFLYI